MGKQKTGKPILSLMQNFTAFPAVIIAFSFILGECYRIPPVTAQMIAQMQFEDVQNHWAQACIENLAADGVISGYAEDSTFRPNAPVTRAEFAGMLRQAFAAAPKTREPIRFIDIPTDYWAYDAIQEAYQTGFLSGYSGSIFNPMVKMTRAQVLVALVKGLNYQPTHAVDAVLNQVFEDAAAIPTEAKAAIAAAAEKSLVVNYPNLKQLNPNQNVSRAEVAAFLCQAKAKGSASGLVATEYIVQVPNILEEETKTELAEFGRVRAELSYQPQPSNFSKNIRLKILRQGVTQFEDAVAIPRWPMNAAAAPEIQFLRLQAIDLDGDQEPEILVDFRLKNANNSSYASLIYHLDSPGNQYIAISHFWGNVTYQLQDLEQDNIFEFISLDSRFENSFNSPLGSRYPLQIWQYRRGNITEATSQYPAPVNTHAAELWLESNRGLAENQDVKAALAAYLADKYILSQGEDGWNLVKKVYQNQDREAFFTQLQQLLQTTGYAAGSREPLITNPTPSPEPTPEPTVSSASIPEPEPTAAPANTPEPTPSPTPTAAPAITPLRSFPGSSQNPVLSVAISADNTLLISGNGKEIQLWNLQTGSLIRTLSGHAGDVRSLAISPDGKTLASGSGDSTIRLWNLETGEQQKAFWHSGWVTTVGFSQDGKSVIACSYDKGIKVWEISSGKLVDTLDGSNPMAIGFDGRLMASNGGNNLIQLWDVETKKVRATLGIPETQTGTMRGIAISQDGETLANGMTGSNSILLWDVNSQEIRRTLRGHADAINAIAISPDGEVLASSSQDGTIKLWRVSNGRMITSIEGFGSVTFSPDNTLLVGVKKNNTIQVWRLSDLIGAREQGTGNREQ